MEATLIRSSVGAHLHSPRLDAWLVAELHQGHQHGEPQPADQDVEDPRHIAQTERAGLVLSAQTDGWKTGTWSHQWCWTWIKKHLLTDLSKAVKVHPSSQKLNPSSRTKAAGRGWGPTRDPRSETDLHQVGGFRSNYWAGQANSLDSQPLTVSACTLMHSQQIKTTKVLIKTFSKSVTSRTTKFKKTTNICPGFFCLYFQI